MNTTKMNRPPFVTRWLCAGAALALLSGTIRAQDFSIGSLSSANATTIEVNSLTGDDRGGIAVSSTHVFLTGDAATARFARGALSGGTGLGVIRDSLVSDLRTEKVYLLANGTTPIAPKDVSGSVVINSLLELDSSTGAPNGTVVTLSSTISVPGNNSSTVGIFAGWGRVLIHNGTRVYQITLPSGAVTDLGALGIPTRTSSESWAYWGVAETIGGANYLAYVRSGTTIARTRISDGTVSTIATFANLSDMASFTVVPSLGRWYFHHEGTSQFRAGDETLGFADATMVVPPNPPTITSQPASLTVITTEAATFSVAVNGAQPIAYQWQRNGVDIAGATSSTLTIASTVAGDAAAYTVVVANSFGTVTSAPAVLALEAITPDLFKITSLKTNNFLVIDPLNQAGDDRGGLVASATRVFLRGDDGVGAYNITNLTGAYRLGTANNGATNFFQYDSLISDLRSQKVYLLGNGTTPIGVNAGTATTIMEIHGTNGAVVGAPIPLSASIALGAGGLYTANVGLFSGWGRLVIHNGSNAYSIDPATGTVTDLGAMARPVRAVSESWAYWGVAEYWGGSVRLVYGRDAQAIVRAAVPSGATEVLGSFANLNDLASFTAAPALNRWFFHMETINQFTNYNNYGGEVLGYADATFIYQPVGQILLTSTALTVLEDSGAATVTGFVTEAPVATASFSVSSDNAALFSSPPVIAADRTLSFTPAANAFGSATVTITARDAASLPIGSTTFTITVTPVNDVPSFTLPATSVTVLEDSGAATTAAFATSISAGPANESSQAVNFLVSNDNTTLFSSPPAIAADGTLTFTPAANAYGSATVTVRAQDNGGTANGGVDTSAAQTFTITVTAVNDAPSITLAANTVTVLEDSGAYSGPLATFSTGPANESAQSITSVAVTGNSNPGLFSVAPSVSTSGVLTFTPAANANGSATVTITAQDNGGTANGGVDTSAPVSFTINVTAVNDAPSFSLYSVASPSGVSYLKSSTGTPWGNSENEAAMNTAFGVGNWNSFSIETVNVASLLSTNKFLFLEGSDSIANELNTFLTANLAALQAWVSNGGSLFINAAPNEGGNINFGFGVFLIYPGSGGTATAANPAHAIFNGPQSPVGSTWTGGWFSHAFVSGAGLVQLIRDESSRTVLGELSAGRGNVLFGGMTTPNFHNPQPQARNLRANILAYGASKANFLATSADQVVAEDSGAHTIAGIVTGIAAGPANESSQVVDFLVSNDNNALFASQPAIAADGTLTFTPAANANGSATVTVRAHDDGGTANGGVDTSAPQTFTITVNSVNDAPTATFATNIVVVLEDSGARTYPNFATFSPGPANESTQTVTVASVGYSVLTGDAGLFINGGGPVVDNAGTLTFTPAPNANGTATVYLVLQDNGGTANGGVDTSATLTFTVTVLAVNDAPVITLASNVVVLEDIGPVSLASFATISTGPANESGQSITNLSVSSDNPGLFSAAPALTGGTLTFTPAANAYGVATVTVVAQDDGGTANGGVDKATNTFTITVNSVNDAPSFTLRPVNTQSSLLNNGSFETGDFTGWVVADTANANPTLAVRANGANLGFFNASASDGTQSATHGFNGANAGTISIAQDVALPPGGVATLTFTYRLAWNTFGSTAASDRTFRVSVQPAGGGAELSGQTLLAAAPNTFGLQTANQSGSVDLSAYAGQSIRIAFVTTIPAGDVANGSFQLDNVRLSATTPDFTIYENSGANTTTTFATDISAGPANESAQTVAFQVSNNNNGLFSSQPAIAADGTLTFTPATDVNGVATVTVRAQDNGGTANGGVDTSAPRTFTITVLPVNSAPRVTVTTANIVVNEDSAAYSGTVATITTGPADESSQSITNVVTGNDNNALFSVQPTVSASGVLTFTLAANQNGSATVTFTPQDNGGTANGGVNQTTRTLTITVTAVNDAPSFALPAGALGPAGVVWTPRDSGRNWNFIASSADGTKLAAVVGNGQIYVSTDSGATWTARESVRNWAEITMSADGTKLAATVTGGQIYTSGDSGVTWTARESSRNWRDITSSADGTLLAAVDNYGSGSGGMIYVSTDSGVTWTPRASNRSWTGITCTPDGTILVATHEQGMIYRSTDSGVTWAALPNAGARNWRRVCVSADGTKIAAGTYGDFVYLSADSGATWTAAGSLGSGVWYDIACSSDGTKLVTGRMSGRIYTSTDSGMTWTAQDSNRDWLGVAMSADGSKLAATVANGGQIYTSVGVVGPYSLAVLEDSGAYSGGANFATSISAGPVDESGQALNFLVSNNNNTLFSSQPAIAADGTLTFTPAANAFGSATVTVQLHDNGGTANGGVDTSAAQTFTITVTGVNEAPTVAFSSSNVTRNEDSGAYSQSSFATVTSFGPNESGQALVGHVVTTDNPGLFSAQPAINPSGTLTFTPAANSNGVATVTVVSQDNGGTANGGVDKTTNTFTITITAVNDAPSFALNGGVLNTGAVGGGGSGDGLIVGGVTFFPASGAVLVAPDLTYTNSLSPTTSGAQVSIDNGQTGDVLGFNTTLATSYGITGSYNSTTKVLSFTGTATTAQYQDVLRSVTYSNSSGSPSTVDRTITFNVGANTLYNPANGHFYEYKSSGLSWLNAKAAAATNYYQGMQGYLATVTSQAENDFIKTKLQADAWIGASDAFDQINAAVGSTLYANQSASEGRWYWVTGPEAGTQFSQNNFSPSSVSGRFMNWNNGEPNNSGGNENYAEFYTTGKWNDLSGVQSLPYVVEYGGLPGDPALTLSLSGSRTVTYNPILAALEDSGTTTILLAVTNISAGPADESGQTVTFTVTNNNNALFLVQPYIDGTDTGTPGALHFTLATNANGSATVTIIAHDNGGTANSGVDTSAAHTFTIVVNNVNDAPSVTFAQGTVTVLEDSGAASVSSFAAFSPGPANESGQTVSVVSVTAASSGLFSTQPAIAANGTLTFTPAANANGSSLVTVIVQDNGGTANGGVDKATNTFTITITAVNDAPSFALPSGPLQTAGDVWTARPTGNRFWYGTIAMSADGRKLAAPAYQGPIYTSDDYGVTWTPRQPSGQWKGITSSADGTKLAAVLWGSRIWTSSDSGQTWTEQQGAPLKHWSAVASSADGTKLAAVVNGNGVPGPIYTSPDSGVTWTAQNSGNQAWTTIASSSDGTKLIAASWVGQVAISTDSGVTWTANSTDPNNSGTTRLWQSVATSADGTKLVAVGSGTQVYTSADAGATWVAHSTDPNSTATTRNWLSVACSQDGTKLVAADNGGMIYTSTDFGDTWTAHSTDPNNAATTRNWWAVASSADGSRLAAADQFGQIYTSSGGPTPYTLAVNEDSGAYAGGANFATSISAGPADESAQVVDFLVSNDNNALFSSQPAIAANGTLTFTPAANAFGSATVTVRAHDNGGTANGGVDTSAAQTFTITVAAVNDAPSITLAANTVTVLEDSGAASVSSFAAFSPGPANESGQTVSVVSVTAANSGLFSTQPAIAANGTLTFTPAANANGSSLVTVIVQDNGGTANGGVDTSAPVSFTINVTAVNDAPSFMLPGSSLQIAQQPEAQTVAVGAAASLSVIALGISPVSYQWQKDGVDIAGQTGSTLNFATVSRSDRAIYRVRVTDGLGASVTSSEVALAVRPAGSARSILLSGEATGRSGTLSGLGHTVATVAANGFGSIDLRQYDFIWLGNATYSGLPDRTNDFVSYLRLGGAILIEAHGATAANQFPYGGNISIVGASGDSVRIVETGNATVQGVNSAGLSNWGNSWHSYFSSIGSMIGVADTGTSGQWMIATRSVGAGRVTFTGLHPAGHYGSGQSAQWVNQMLAVAASPLITGHPQGGSVVAGGTANLSVTASGSGLTYQWLRNGVPYAGATSPTLTLPSFDQTLAGSWTVQVSDGSETMTSEAAVLGVQTVGDVSVVENSGPDSLSNFATSISAGPANESGQALEFLVTTDHPELFSVQPAIAADGTLTFTPASSGYGTASVTVRLLDNGGTANGGVDTSGPQTFNITVTEAARRVFISGTPTAAQGDTLTVPILLKATGVEAGLGFTLNFDASKLSYRSAALGTDATGASLHENSSSAGAGRVGLVVAQPAGSTFSAGTSLQILLVTFQVNPTAAVGASPVTFTDVVTRREVSDASANAVAAVFAGGSVTITAGVASTDSNYEGDVAPRPYGNGNGSVTVADAVQIGRFAAGLDAVANGSEFQRADCAPLGSKGDGRLTVSDYVQALRFAAGLDTPGTVGGPLVPASLQTAASLRVPAGNRVVRVVSGNLVAGQANTVTVQVDAQGNEAGLSLSLAFDATALTFVSATTGSGASGGSLMVNSVKAAAGKVGLVLALPAGSTLAAGTRDVVTLTFNVAGSGATGISVTGDSPVTREVADANANVLGASFVGGSFNIILPACLKAAGMERAADGSLRLVVRNADGTPVTAAQAAKYEVQVTSNLGGAWTVLPNALVVENGALKIVDPAASSAGLRLYKLVEKP